MITQPGWKKKNARNKMKKITKSFEEYIRLHNKLILIRLLFNIDTPYENNILDQMDLPWWNMTDEEKEAANYLPQTRLIPAQKNKERIKKEKKEKKKDIQLLLYQKVNAIENKTKPYYKISNPILKIPYIITYQLYIKTPYNKT